MAQAETEKINPNCSSLPNDLVDILGNIEAGKCDTIDLYCRAFEFMGGAKLSTIQTGRKSPWNWDLENLKTVWAAKSLTPPTHS
jgi:hypothetical protein